MPITQSRMLQLIDAAQDFKNGLETARDLIETNRRRVAEGQLPAEVALETLFQITNPDLLLRNPVESKLTLLSEIRHFRLNAKKNEANRERKRRKARIAMPSLPPNFIAPTMDQLPEWESNSDQSDQLEENEELF